MTPCPSCDRLTGRPGTWSTCGCGRSWPAQPVEVTIPVPARVVTR